MSVATRVFGNFKKSMEGKKTALPLSVQKVEMESANVARVIVNIPDVFHKSLTEAEIAGAVDATMKGARYLDGSFCSTGTPNLFNMFVTSTGKVMSKEDASTSDLREVATNVFRDEDDNIWNYKEDETGSYFVAQDVEDLEALILGARARSSHIATASLEVATAESFQKDMPIMVYDTASAGYQFGIAIDDTQVYFPKGDKIAQVNPTRVVAAWEVAAADRGMPRINFTAKDKKKALLDYMRALYGQNAAYYKRIEALVRQNLRV